VLHLDPEPARAQRPTCAAALQLADAQDEVARWYMWYGVKGK
jgi:hypothetical protein